MTISAGHPRSVEEELSQHRSALTLVLKNLKDEVKSVPKKLETEINNILDLLSKRNISKTIDTQSLILLSHRVDKVLSEATRLVVNKVGK